MDGKPCDRLLDLRGWSCPWCIVKAKSCLDRMEPGHRLEVLCTDPGVRIRFQAVLERTGHRILGWEDKEDHVCVIITKGPGGEGHER